MADGGQSRGSKSLGGAGASTLVLASSLGSVGRLSSTSRSAGAVAAVAGLNRRDGAAEILNVGLAGLLVVGVANIVGDTLVEEFLADEGRHGLLVVLETWSRSVAGASALVLESGLELDVSFGAQSDNDVIWERLTGSQVLSSVSPQRLSQVFR